MPEEVLNLDVQPDGKARTSTRDIANAIFERSKTFSRKALASAGGKCAMLRSSHPWPILQLAIPQGKSDQAAIQMLGYLLTSMPSRDEAPRPPYDCRAKPLAESNVRAPFDGIEKFYSLR